MRMDYLGEPALYFQYKWSVCKRKVKAKYEISLLSIFALIKKAQCATNHTVTLVCHAVGLGQTGLESISVVIYCKYRINILESRY